MTRFARRASRAVVEPFSRQAPGYLRELSYIYSLERRGIRFGLGRITRVLRAAGSPHLRYPAVIVAGTNGKGSVSATIEAVVRGSGLRTGLYTSPHLVNFEERIKVNGKDISPEEVVSLISRVRDLVRQSSSRLTFFEFATVMAFIHFLERRIDMAVLEVGMGGRLDATNTARPVVSVITGISVEHAQYLGRTLPAIAGEKAGVVRRSVPCVSGPQRPVVSAFLRRHCLRHDSRLCEFGRDFSVFAEEGGKIEYRGLSRKIDGIMPAMAGAHQIVNIAVALAAVENASRALGIWITDGAVRSAVAGVAWPGRLQTIIQKPEVIVDGCHNPAAAEALAVHLASAYRGRNITIVFGVLGDKDVEKMLEKLAPLASTLILTEPPVRRARNPYDYFKTAAGLCGNTFVVSSYLDAFRQAVNTPGRDSVIVITGSLYLAGEALKERDLIASFAAIRKIGKIERSRDW